MAMHKLELHVAYDRAEDMVDYRPARWFEDDVQVHWSITSSDRCRYIGKGSC